MYIEVRLNTVKEVGSLVDASTFVPKYIEVECYNSMFGYGEEGLAHWQAHGTCKDYNGSVVFNKLWIDIDSRTNLSLSQKAAVLLVDELVNKYGVHKDGIAIYFSGGKGFHIGLDSVMFNKLNFESSRVPSICKRMVGKLTMIDITDKEAVRNSPIDFAIYNHTRVFRTPLSKHASGNYKVMVSVDQIKTLTIEEIVERARTKVSSKFSYKQRIVPKLVELFDECEKEPDEFRIASPTNTSKNTLVTTSFFVPIPGERNNQMYKQAFRLFSIGSLKREEVWDIMRIIHESSNVVASSYNDKGMHIAEFNALMSSAETRSYKNRAIGSDYEIATFEELISSSFSSIVNSKFIPTTIPEFDAELDGGMQRGNVYYFIGKGGTKKSMITQCMAIRTATLPADVFGIWYNLEMSNTQLFKRGFNMILKSNFKDLVSSGNLDLEKVRSYMENVLKSRLITISGTGENLVNVETIKKSIIDIEEKRRIKVSYIIVDSIGAMDMGNHETQSMIKYSGQFKQLAKELDVAVIIVNHVNQSCDAHFRDTSPYVRGGGKIIDNGDGYFSLSRIVDVNKSNHSTRAFVYEDDLVWIRMVNKRESGAVIDKIVTLNKDFTFSPLQEDPNNYEKIYL